MAPWIGAAVSIPTSTLLFWCLRTIAPGSLWMLLLPLPAAIRGIVQPIIKLGLERWPNPIAAVVVGYAVSSGSLAEPASVQDEAESAIAHRLRTLHDTLFVRLTMMDVTIFRCPPKHWASQ
jgi:hypothetical protein